jgi:GT2 family glycosyltransferase
MIGIVTIAYNQPDHLINMAHSAVRSTKEKVVFFLFRHSNMARVIDACSYIYSDFDCVYHPLGRNAGVARSWNNGLLEAADYGCDAIFLVNDDIVFSEGDIDKMLALKESKDAWAVFCSGLNVGNDEWLDDHGLACALMTAQGIESVGMFDENFFPAYNEDIDYARRAGLAGLHTVTAETEVRHIGSAAIKASPALRQQNHTTHGKNDEYWERKWGAKKPKARFSWPFNSRRYHQWYIHPDSRHAPYPGMDRTDHGIVKI